MASNTSAVQVPEPTAYSYMDTIKSTASGVLEVAAAGGVSFAVATLTHIVNPIAAAIYGATTQITSMAADYAVDRSGLTEERSENIKTAVEAISFFASAAAVFGIATSSGYAIPVATAGVLAVSTFAGIEVLERMVSAVSNRFSSKTDEKAAPADTSNTEAPADTSATEAPANTSATAAPADTSATAAPANTSATEQSDDTTPDVKS